MEFDSFPNINDVSLFDYNGFIQQYYSQFSSFPAYYRQLLRDNGQNLQNYTSSQIPYYVQQQGILPFNEYTFTDSDDSILTDDDFSVMYDDSLTYWQNWTITVTESFIENGTQKYKIFFSIRNSIPLHVNQCVFIVKLHIRCSKRAKLLRLRP